MSASPSVLHAGDRLGPYRLVHRVALGGMAEVWAAREGERDLALKVMRSAFADEDELHTMFEDEVQISRLLRHENIVEVYGGEAIEGYLVQVMELIEGMDLRKVNRRLEQRRWRFPIPLVAYVARCMARALGYAHKKRGPRGRPLDLVHRDVSPHNVMLGRDGRVKLLDFGIAKAEERATRTAAGLVKGKTAYMAPEQATNRPLDHRTDIFATGIVLWECLAGRRLFQANSDVGTMEQIVRGEVPELEAFRADVPSELSELIRSMLAVDPEGRPGSMLDVERGVQRMIVRRFEPEQAGPAALATWLAKVGAQRTEGTARLPPAPNVLEVPTVDRGPKSASSGDLLDARTVPDDVASVVSPPAGLRFDPEDTEA